jgi:hypothetical protein
MAGEIKHSSVYGPGTEMRKLLDEQRWSEAEMLEAENLALSPQSDDELDTDVEGENWHLCPLDESDWAAVGILRQEGELDKAEQIIQEMNERRSRCLGEVATGIDYECGLLHGNGRDEKIAAIPEQRQSSLDTPVSEAS